MNEAIKRQNEKLFNKIMVHPIKQNIKNNFLKSI